MCKFTAKGFPKASKIFSEHKNYDLFLNKKLKHIECIYGKKMEY